MPRTAQQEINYRVALTKLVEAMETFVEVARRNGRKVHSFAWNHRAMYRHNGHRKRWSVTLMGPEGSTSREKWKPPVVYERPPRPRK